MQKNFVNIHNFAVDRIQSFTKYLRKSYVSNSTSTPGAWGEGGSAQPEGGDLELQQLIYGGPDLTQDGSGAYRHFACKF